MENFKFNLMIIIVFVVLGGVIYWSVSSINNNIYYTRDIENAEPETPEIVIETPTEEETVTEEETEPEVTQVSEEDAELIAKIEKLISDKVYMKNGSQGTRVGTLQEFLNVYFDTNKAVDNDYGPGTESSVRDFQEHEGLAVDGQTGPETYQAMIDWLESN